MEKIYDLLQQIRPEFDFKKSNDFIVDGYLDSFDVVTLVSELDAMYNISIDALDIVPENFGTVEDIISVVERNGGVTC